MHSSKHLLEAWKFSEAGDYENATLCYRKHFRFLYEYSQKHDEDFFQEAQHHIDGYLKLLPFTSNLILSEEDPEYLALLHQLKCLRYKLRINELEYYDTYEAEHINRINRLKNKPKSEIYINKYCNEIDWEEAEFCYQRKLYIQEKLSTNEIKLLKIREYKFNETLHWGKYKNQKLITVLENDPEYILWCTINLRHFILSDSIFAVNDIINSPNYYTGIRFNTYKKWLHKEWKIDYNFNGNINYWNHVVFYEIPYNLLLSDSEIRAAEMDHYEPDDPRSYGYSSWEEMEFREVYEGNINLWMRRPQY